jgi:FPC/CPF motif-containing protein YcgG
MVGIIAKGLFNVVCERPLIGYPDWNRELIYQSIVWNWDQFSCHHTKQKMLRTDGAKLFFGDFSEKEPPLSKEGILENE